MAGTVFDGAGNAAERVVMDGLKDARDVLERDVKKGGAEVVHGAKGFLERLFGGDEKLTPEKQAEREKATPGSPTFVGPEEPSILSRIVGRISRIFEGILNDAEFAAAQAHGRIMPPDAKPVAAGTVVGDVQTTAEKAVGRVAEVADGAADAARKFAANAAMVTASVAAESAPSGERTVPVAEFLAVPPKGEVPAGVTSGVTAKSDFNYAAPGAPLPALQAAIDGEPGSRFDRATYNRARAQIAEIKPSGMG